MAKKRVTPSPAKSASKTKPVGHTTSVKKPGKSTARPKVMAKSTTKPTAKVDSKPGKAGYASKPINKPLPRQKSAKRDTTLEDIAVGNIGSSKFLVDGPKQVATRLPDLPRNYGRDRIVVMVRDPFWLHAYWEVTEHSVRRAESALEQEWHGAKAILRVLDITSDDSTSVTESIVRDIDIHEGCNNWYIDVNKPNPPTALTSVTSPRPDGST